MFDALTQLELQELSERICDARDRVRRFHSRLPGYSGIEADLEAIEITISRFRLW